MIPKVMTLLAALTLWAGLPSTGHLQGVHGCACVHNRTNLDIHFRYKWGNDDWRNRHVVPGGSYAICWGYGSGPHTSPPLLFNLDRDAGPGTAWTTYAIRRIQSAQNACAFVPQGGHYDISFQPGSNNTLIHVSGPR